MRITLSSAVLLGLLSPAGADQPIALSWPVACEVGRSCEVQHYVDHGGPGGAKDYRCGSITYGGHNGTDIRVPTMRDEAAGVDVLAAAAGTVLRSRDGVEDVSVRTIGLAAVADHQCGNGLVIAHLDGFETQYCHMAKASLVVRPGDVVKAGRVLGHVGLSGETEFPHLHITVRHNGQVIDPFAYGEPEGACAGGVALWEPSLAAALAYKAGAVLNAGFANRALSMEDIEAGAGREPIGADPAAIVAFVQAIGLQRGDIQRLVVAGPQATFADQSAAPLAANKDQIAMAVGRKRPPTGWPAGLYTAHYTVQRGSTVALDRSFSLTIGR